MYLKPGFLRKTVGTAGDQERLTNSDLRPVWLRIQPEDDNSTPMYIGDSEVSATNGLEFEVPPTGAADPQAVKSIEMGSTLHGALGISLKDIWVDAGTSTDGVLVFYLEQVQQ